MRLIFVATVLSLAALTPLAAEDDIVLRGMGSFHVGGRIADVSGKPVRMIVRQPGVTPPPNWQHARNWLRRANSRSRAAGA